MSQFFSSDGVGVLVSDLCRFAGAPISGNPGPKDVKLSDCYCLKTYGNCFVELFSFLFILRLSIRRTNTRIVTYFIVKDS